MTERAEELARLIVLENGKALADARGEVAYAAEFFRWFSEEAVRVTGAVQTAPSGANRILVLRQPVGVSVLVTPWNFPAAMATRKIGPALAAGCTVILKPASDTPLTALAMAALLAEAGVPAGVVNVLPSRRSGPVVSAMLHDPRVRKLSFTGSTEVGRLLLGRRPTASSTPRWSSAATRRSSSSTTPTSTPPSTARWSPRCATAARPAPRPTGSTSSGASRRSSPRRSPAAMAELRVGPGLEDGVQVGPLVNADGRDKVAELVAEAVAAGATVATGGQPPDVRRASSTRRPSSWTCRRTPGSSPRRSSARWRPS